MNSEPFNARSDVPARRDEPGAGDDVPCEKCGATALDTGLECSKCGHDNHKAVTGNPFGSLAAPAPQPADDLQRGLLALARADAVTWEHRVLIGRVIARLGEAAAPAPQPEPERHCMNCAEHGECRPGNEHGGCGYDPDDAGNLYPSAGATPIEKCTYRCEAWPECGCAPAPQPAIADLQALLDPVYVSLRDRDCTGAALAMESVLRWAQQAAQNASSDKDLASKAEPEQAAPAPQPAAETQAPSAADQTLQAENAALRRMLACRVAGASLYVDDGELQDNTVLPFIDFRRDSVEEIERKLIDRGIANFAKEASEALAAGRFPSTSVKPEKP